MAKHNLGKVNLKSVRRAVYLTNMHAWWPQGFTLPCADESAIFAICSCFAIIAVFLHCFARKFATLPLPPLLGVFPLKFVQCDGASWWPQAGLVPTHKVAMETSLQCLILAQDPPPTILGTSSQAHLLAMSLMRNCPVCLFSALGVFSLGA